MNRSLRWIFSWVLVVIVAVISIIELVVSPVVPGQPLDGKLAWVCLLMLAMALTAPLELR
jgi:hypothetical protein